MQNFITPPGHTGFLAKTLFNEIGAVKWGATGYLAKGGCGPAGNHAHNDTHVFIVVKGEAKVILGEKSIIVKKNESLFVDGMIPHSIWNNADTETVVVKLSLKRES